MTCSVGQEERDDCSRRGTLDAKIRESHLWHVTVCSTWLRFSQEAGLPTLREYGGAVHALSGLLAGHRIVFIYASVVLFRCAFKLAGWSSSGGLHALTSSCVILAKSSSTRVRLHQTFSWAGIVSTSKRLRIIVCGCR
jgi:hypothetical protein